MILHVLNKLTLMRHLADVIVDVFETLLTFSMDATWKVEHLCPRVNPLVGDPFGTCQNWASAVE